MFLTRHFVLAFCNSCDTVTKYCGPMLRHLASSLANVQPERKYVVEISISVRYKREISLPDALFSIVYQAVAMLFGEKCCSSNAFYGLGYVPIQQYTTELFDNARTYSYKSNFRKYIKNK